MGTGCQGGWVHPRESGSREGGFMAEYIRKGTLWERHISPHISSPTPSRSGILCSASCEPQKHTSTLFFTLASIWELPAGSGDHFADTVSILFCYNSVLPVTRGTVQTRDKIAIPGPSCTVPTELWQLGNQS